MAEVVVAVKTWDYGLDILTRLASCKDIRDAILRHDQLSLPSALSKAIRDDARSRDIAAAVALLQHRLPDDVPLPATAQDLLCRLFEQAATAPKKGIVGSVHTLLKGACWPLLDILSPDTLRRFETHVFAILRDATDVDDPFILLYCLSIMKTLVQSSHTVTASSSQRLTLSSPSRHGWKSDAMRSFFDGVKAHKTLQLLVMRVIWACKSEAALKDKHECVRLANYIVAGVSRDVRLDWSERNTAAVRKLHEKCSSDDLTPGIQFQALSFSSTLSLDNAYPMARFLTVLIGPSQKSVLLCDFEQCLHISGDVLERCMDGVAAGDLLNGLLTSRTDKSGSPAQSIMRMAILARFVEEHMIRYANISQEVVTWANLDSTKQTLNAMLHVCIDQQGKASRDHRFYCESRDHNLTATLLSAISSLILSAGLNARHAETELHPHLVALLLKAHAGSWRRDCGNAALTRPRLDVLSVAMQGSPESDPAKRHDWRARLVSEMQQQAEQRQQDLTSTVAVICAELEERCNNVEEPLRVEREQKRELESRLQDLEQAYQQLEVQLMDRELTVSALETENEKSVYSLDQISAERVELLRKVSMAEEHLREVSQSARQEIAKLQEENRNREMDKATALACKREVLDSVQTQANNLQQRLLDSESELEAQKGHCQQVERQNEALRNSLITKESELEDTKHNLTHANTRHEEASKESEGLRRDLETQRESNAAAQRNSEDLRNQLNELRLSNRQDMERAEDDFHTRLDEERQRWRQEQERIEMQLSQIRQEQAEVEEAHDTEQQAAAAKVQEQRKRIERLTKELAKKEAQVVEVQEMRNRLMSAMGLNLPVAQSPPKQSTLPYRSASSAGTPQTQVPRTPAREASQPDFEDEITNLSFGSAGSSQTGPTPKRAKPRKAFKVPSLQQPRLSAAHRSTRSALRGASASVMKRQPLADMSANRSPVRAGRSPGKVAFKKVDVAYQPMSTDNRNALAEWSFTTDVLTSTPGIGLNKVQDELDESTADC